MIVKKREQKIHESKFKKKEGKNNEEHNHENERRIKSRIWFYQRKNAAQIVKSDERPKEQTE